MLLVIYNIIPIIKVSKHILLLLLKGRKPVLIKLALLKGRKPVLIKLTLYNWIITYIYSYHRTISRVKNCLLLFNSCLHHGVYFGWKLCPFLKFLLSSHQKWSNFNWKSERLGGLTVLLMSFYPPHTPSCLYDLFAYVTWFGPIVHTDLSCTLTHCFLLM